MWRTGLNVGKPPLTLEWIRARDCEPHLGVAILEGCETSRLTKASLKPW
jgi:hypothetical protein